MADFNDFVQTELPKRPFTTADGNVGDVLVRSSNTLAPREVVWSPIASILPVATGSTLGVVKQGANVTISADGTLSVSASGGGFDALANLPTSTTFSYNGDGTVHIVDEVIGGMHVIATYSYNGDGTVSEVATTYAGQTRTETFTYNGDGTVASITAIIS